MKLVLKQFLLSTAILLTGVACTSETHEGLSNPSSPSDGDDLTRREVVVTLRNQLSLAKGTKAGEIATVEENKIASLDVYAFGSDTEDGTYTLQERFAYREDPADLPATATPIDLEQPGDGKEASVSLKLQKGLFVKLYAVANQPELVDPTGTIGQGTTVGTTGKVMQDGDFKPLSLTTPGQAGTTVQTVGVPTETEFLTFHSLLLDAATPADVLVSPLPMSGAYTIPLDLTDFESFSRLQAGFKLTRTVARFDVVNNAADSRFTITRISMGNARRGTTFFPAKPYATTPADPADLITLPARTFTGLTNANTGITASAFYSYPSPQADNGYIILEGTYRMNETDPEKTVSYQIPFKQEVNGTGSHIEVNPNHRYTITISKADDYHIDFDLTVADWSDAGNDLDGFEPPVPPSPVTFSVTVNQDLADAYKNAQPNLTAYPPFNYDGGASTGTTGSDRNGVSSSCTVSKTYSIEVEKTERGSYSDYATAISYCSGKGSGWRVPTMIELKAIYDNKTTLQNNGCASFSSNGYWSSSVYDGYSSDRCELYFSNGGFGNAYTGSNQGVRCVRDI
ncbi:DUF1566 domain-containing protein [Parabacteroides timonensis]|uniref:DUF1566 domain-containing protein n=1 Tax=Parabacteroides timonensis TaxID=1871013 RepID=UPI00094E0E73|nr:DUF1566 domain-containing protein [Parabacteroides timonensis]